MSKILNFFTGLFSVDYYDYRRKAEEEYLAQSVDHYDLERRQRELDKGQFNGGRYRSLYQRFYN